MVFWQSPWMFALPFERQVSLIEPDTPHSSSIHPPLVILPIEEVSMLAATVVPVLELAKWMERQGWFGRMD